MAKYDPLMRHLYAGPAEPMELTFDEVDALVGGLPDSARRQRGWWGNDAGAGSRHAQANAWLGAGREVVHVDLAGGRVRFSAPAWLRGA